MSASSSEQPESSYPPGGWWTKKQVAKFLNWSVRTLERKVQRGSFPRPVKLSGLPRFERQAVLAYIEQSKRREQP